ncbi:MAG TPA: hypothetical protein VFW62_08890, partial [bacterium]|nr:hypothetical protein [bacterium]
GDGCDGFCEVESGFICSGEPSVCVEDDGGGDGEADGGGCSLATAATPGFGSAWIFGVFGLWVTLRRARSR